jgi:ATP-dependent Clp protease ATP-binding subunit ClpX
VQHGLLRMIEGSIINVPANGGKKHNNQEYIQVDTKNILFICAGAFEDLPQIVSKDIKQAAIGFHGHHANKTPDYYEDILKSLQEEKA